MRRNAFTLEENLLGMYKIGIHKSLENDYSKIFIFLLFIQKIQLPSSNGFTWLQYWIITNLLSICRNLDCRAQLIMFFLLCFFVLHKLKYPITVPLSKVNI